MKHKKKSFGEKYISALNNEGIRIPKKGLKWKTNFTPPTEDLIGITPEESEKISLFSKYRDSFAVHKSSKKNQNSFRVTKSLLESLIETSIKIQKKPILIISIVNGPDEYTLTCSVTKK